MGIYQYNLGQLWHGRQIYTMYHVFVDGLPNNAMHAVFAQALIDAYLEVLQANLSTAWATNSCSFRRIDIADQPTISIAGLTHFAGTDATNSVSRSNSILMRFFSNTSPPNRGWRFVGGMTEANWTGTEWLLAIRNNVELLGEAIIDAAATSYEGLDSNLVVVRWNTAHTAVAASNAVLSGDPPGWQASQNKRRF